MKDQLDKLIEIEEREEDRRTAREMRELLEDWKEHFSNWNLNNFGSNGYGYFHPSYNFNANGSDHPLQTPPPQSQQGEDDTTGTKKAPFPSPLQVKEEINRLQNRVLELETSLSKTIADSNKRQKELEEDLANHSVAFRKTSQVDRERHATTIDDLESKYRAQVSQAKQDVIQAKKDAREVIDYIRKKTKEEIEECKKAVSQEKETLQNEFEKKNAQKQKEIDDKIKELNEKIQQRHTLLKQAVAKESKKLKHEHAIELSKAKREGILKGSKAVFRRRGKISSLLMEDDNQCYFDNHDHINNYCDCNNNHYMRMRNPCNHDRRFNNCVHYQQQAACRERRPQSSYSCSYSPEIIASSPTSNCSSSVRSVDTSENNHSRGERQQTNSNNKKQNNVIVGNNWRLCNKEEECQWMKSRIHDLEDMVQTLINALESDQ